MATPPPTPTKFLPELHDGKDGWTQAVKLINELRRRLNALTVNPAVPEAGAVIFPSDGEDGEDGMPGLPGLDGADGLPGHPGAAGAMGPWGNDGEDGADSFIPGQRGAPGLDGRSIPGLQGDEGEEGAMGVPIPGPQGPIGYTGAVGYGMAGDDGEEGWPGRPGVAGAAGTNGTNGTNGLSIPGPPGADADEFGEPWSPPRIGLAAAASYKWSINFLNSGFGLGINTTNIIVPADTGGIPTSGGTIFGLAGGGGIPAGVKSVYGTINATPNYVLNQAYSGGTFYLEVPFISATGSGNAVVIFSLWYATDMTNTATYNLLASQTQTIAGGVSGFQTFSPVPLTSGIPAGAHIFVAVARNDSVATNVLINLNFTVNVELTR